jgi:Spy/CpxP family protein refolding chaperone
MIARLTRNPLLALAVFGLSATVAVSQQTPPATAPATPAPAPIERQPPSNPQPPPQMRPGMRPGMNMPQAMQQRSRMMRSRDNFRAGMEGGPGGFHMGPGGMWWKNPAVVQRLSLTPEQTKKMDSIFQESRIQLIDLKANVEKQQVMLEPLLSANPLDTTKAMAQIDKVAQARADLEKANAKMLLGIRATLTPDQWTKLRDRASGFNPQGNAPAGQGGPGTPGGPGGGPGRGRGPRPGAPGTSDFTEPIDQP